MLAKAVFIVYIYIYPYPFIALKHKAANEQVTSGTAMFSGGHIGVKVALTPQRANCDCNPVYIQSIFNLESIL